MTIYFLSLLRTPNQTEQTADRETTGLIWNRAVERKLKEQFDRLHKTGILLASLMKREGS